MENVFDLLKKRGFVYQTSNETGLKELLGKPGATIYCGFDPSASSFHLGQLIILMAFRHLQRSGHKIIFLLGGGTGKIGDPTGKDKSRKLLDLQTVEANKKELAAQVEEIGLLKFSGPNAAVMLDNNDWLSKFKFLDEFLLDVARHFSVNEMVSMDTFKKRLNSQTNLSLLEFCYPVLQAWDFLYLFENHDCRVQIGGSDQWANILAGTGLIRRKHRQEAFALTFPLLTTPSGEKMGKTEKGPIWLDDQRTSPFEMYQYLINVNDSLVTPMLKLLTALPLEKIATIEKGSPQEAQQHLAFEVTKLVHGEEAAQKARTDSEKLFGKGEGRAETIPIFETDPGLTIEEILVKSGSLPSKSEVRRRVEQNGITIDGKEVPNAKMLIIKSSTIKFGKTRFLKIQCK